MRGAAAPRSGLDINDKRKGRVGPAGRDLVLANVKGDGIVALVDADPLTTVPSWLPTSRIISALLPRSMTKWLRDKL